MTPDQFWSSTIAQLSALLPESPKQAEGTAGDLLALAQMNTRR